jgi:hypothetical protein
MTRVEKRDDTYWVEEVVTLFGFIKVPNQYAVQVSSSPVQSTVIYTSQIKPSVTLEIVWKVEAGDRTSITEKINVKANPIVRLILCNVMKHVHKKIINQLRD